MDEIHSRKSWLQYRTTFMEVSELNKNDLSHTNAILKLICIVTG
jgi:hypothetical protein